MRTAIRAPLRGLRRRTGASSWRPDESRRQAADQALATLCQSYWYPLYAYVRRHVKDAARPRI